MKSIQQQPSIAPELAQLIDEVIVRALIDRIIKESLGDSDDESSMVVRSSATLRSRLRRATGCPIIGLTASVGPFAGVADAARWRERRTVANRVSPWICLRYWREGGGGSGEAVDREQRRAPEGRPAILEKHWATREDLPATRALLLRLDEMPIHQHPSRLDERSNIGEANDCCDGLKHPVYIDFQTLRPRSRRRASLPPHPGAPNTQPAPVFGPRRRAPANGSTTG